MVKKKEHEGGLLPPVQSASSRALGLSIPGTTSSPGSIRRSRSRMPALQSSF
jgi:hypothetical protein